MVLKLYDTLSREVQDVFPMDGKIVRFYCCGPTVYGPAHVGNFRTFVLQDIFRRALETCGQKTYHARNLTDVDDKTIRQSQEEGVSLGDFTDRWTKRFNQDCHLLNLLPPHVQPSAVAHVPEQIALIQRLIDGGKAYQGPDGSVYFKVDSFEKYGALSRLADREITTSSRERETSDEYQRDSAADFALWKARRPEDGENYWNSPWGEGRPGWHIECSAICLKHLGESFDLHSGGVDLVFPHHENEIAQVEAVTDKTFARHWFHITHLMVEGTKMSKSLGNLYTLSDLQEKGYDAQTVRYVLLSGSYRQPLNFTFDSLKAAQKALKKLQDFSQKIELAKQSSLPLGSGNFGPFTEVQKAMLTDLNTADALGKLFGQIKEISESISQGKLPLDSEEIKKIQDGFASVLNLFGFHFTQPEAEIAPAEVISLADLRWIAKSSKDWAEADRLRDEIKKAGWVVKDTKDSYGLEKIV